MRRPIFSFPEKLNGGVFGAVVVVSKTQLFRSHIADINPLMAFVLSSVGRVLMKRTPSCSVRTIHPTVPRSSSAMTVPTSWRNGRNMMDSTSLKRSFNLLVDDESWPGVILSCLDERSGQLAFERPNNFIVDWNGFETNHLPSDGRRGRPAVALGKKEKEEMSNHKRFFFCVFILFLI